MTKEIDQPTDETEQQTPAGAPADDQVAGVDENGQEEPQESEDVKNDNKWKAENTKKSQELAEEKRRLEAERNAVENEKRLIEERKANEAYEKSLEYMDPEERARAVKPADLTGDQCPS